MRRRPYLLLEVVVALGLVALCALPLLRPLFAATRHELKIASALHLQLRADQAFAEVRQQLYNNDIAWTALRKGRPYTGNLPDLGFTFKISEQTKFRKHTNTGETGATYRLLNITVTSGDQSFTYELFAERIYPSVAA
jgi:hypothetical protein